MPAPIEIKEPSSRELHIIEFIAGLDTQITNGAEILKDRLHSIPDGWRQFRIAQSAIDKVIHGLYKTMPNKTLRHMIALVEYGQVVIRPRPSVQLPDDVQIVQSSDLKMLINTAMSAECAICLKNTAEQKACAFRKALMRIAPPVSIPEGGLCAYAEVARSCELGKYI